jgi:hypothetical protein
MRPNTGSRRIAAVLAALGLAVPAVGRGETVDAESTTMLIVRDQTRAGGTYRLAPAYEIVSISARDIQNPVAENLQLVFSGWGAGSLGPNKVWYDGSPPQHPIFADLDLAYLQGEILKRAVQLRLGRQIVAGGVTGVIQLDGANVVVRLPYGVGLSAYTGSPVSQRFEERGLETSFNPARGNFAVGGRASLAVPPWGELGVSAVNVMDNGDPSRRQAGADLRLVPVLPLTVLANGNYDLYEERWAEASLLALVQVAPKVSVGADARHVEPDLFLPRDSILSVFASERRNEAGGTVSYGPWKALTLVADYHYQKQIDEGTGHRGSGRATFRPAKGTTAGLELGGLRSVDGSGYVQARAFAAKEIRRCTATLDLQEYGFRREVNGQKNSFIAIGSLAYALGNGWSALVSGAGSQTPYYQSRFDVMAKLVYNQSYHLREVR